MKALIFLLLIGLLGCNSEQVQELVDKAQGTVDRGVTTYKLKNIELDGNVQNRLHYALIFDCTEDKCDFDGWVMGYQPDVIPLRARRQPGYGTLLRNGEIYTGSLYSTEGCSGELYDMEFNRETKAIRFVNIGWTTGTFDQENYGQMFTGAALDQWATNYELGCPDLH